ncbi:MAG TPA: hypothetical protein VK110_05670 [Salinisphaeraceae bacterium]|nr:hypothetical protein [Salinisphaeraceae bacterium]
MANLTFTPATSSAPAALEIELLDATWQPLAARKVTALFANGDAGVEPIAFPARKLKDNIWQVQDIDLPRLQYWRIGIEALVSDFERLRLQTTLDTHSAQ